MWRIILVIFVSVCWCEVQTSFWSKMTGEIDGEDFPIKFPFLFRPPFNFTHQLEEQGRKELRSTPDLIRKAGFLVELHHVITEDGYELELHRIPARKARVGEDANTTSDKNTETNQVSHKSIPVLLLHGYASTSLHWILSPKHVALPYKLAENGYDVWLGNFRGNKYSNRHITLDNTDSRYWNFSWHEMGMYDVPAMMDYVLNVTSEPQLFYIGHSMGCTAFFVSASMKTEYNDKVKAMFSLAPVAFMNHIRNTTRLILPLVVTDKLALDALAHGELVPANVLETLRIFGSLLCSPASTTSGLCDQFLRHVAGVNPESLNKTWVPALFRNYPDSSSARTLLHFLQLVKSGEFRQYDYGVLQNWEVYTRLRPPAYNLSRVVAPVAIYWSTEDWLAPPEDIETLRLSLPNVIVNHKIEHPAFTHLDFLAATDSDSLLYDKIISTMESVLGKQK